MTAWWWHGFGGCPMARKKRQGHEGGGRRSRPPTGDVPDLLDRRETEGRLRHLLRQLRGQAEDDTPLGKAQALLYRAFEEPDEQRRVQLAKDALALCPDCADGGTWPGGTSSERLM